MGKIVMNEKPVEETLDILTCPFCGSEDLRLRDEGRGYGYYNYSVVCNRCKTVGPSAGQSRSSENGNKEIAVRLWNNRA